MIEPDWQSERVRFERDVAALAPDARPVLSNASGSILMARASFAAFEGTYETTPRLMISLCMSGVGNFRRFTDVGCAEGIMRPGAFALALPNTEGEGFTPQAEMLGLSIGTTELATFGLAMSGEELGAAAGVLRSDPLIAAVMRAIWLDAETYGMSSSFFQHGAALILQRLAEFRTQEKHRQSTRPLTPQRLAQIQQMIESQLGEDINVSELAKEARQDVRSFTRAFRAATGMAPYAYLTMRRLERAKELLQSQQSITDIAMSIGYSNPSKFAAAFRRMYDCSPREWRNAKR